MRAVRGLFCAVAITACLAPGVRADEYTKQTFLTFSGPVQLPGITLAAGTYQFRLADPESGRRALQVWDKDGNKLYATLLTIPDQRMTPTSDPVVMFGERASGQPQAIRAWFYPNETYGQEFVYPKDQAMRIARENHSSVMAFNDDAKDEAAFKSAKVGRMDENGRMTNADQPQQSSTTSASNTTADHGAQAASTTAASQSQSSTAARSTAPVPSANRSDASGAVGTSGVASTSSATENPTSEANRDNMPSNRAVGTTGSISNATSANRTGQAASGANAAAPRSSGNTAGQSSTGQSSTSPSATAPTGSTPSPARTLPHTASSTTLILLLGGLSLAGAAAVRVFRLRSAQAR